jgi:hypothetical protein
VRPAKYNESTHATRAEAAAWVLEANEESNWQEDHSAQEAQGQEECGLVEQPVRLSRTIHETKGIRHDDGEAFKPALPAIWQYGVDYKTREQILYDNIVYQSN